MANTRGRVAYCTVPKIGGTFNFYRNLRRALAERGWDVVAPVVGRSVNALWDPAYPAEGCAPVAPLESDLKRASMALVEWCDRERIDVLIPMSVQAAVSAIPHLPSGVRPVMRCSNITRHAYDIVTAHLDRICRVVATSRRQYDDLLQLRRVPPEKLVLIPHGVDTTSFEQAYLQRTSGDGPLHVGYLGRLLDSAKSVFLLPLIADRLVESGVHFQWTVVGDGPDRRTLERRFATHASAGRLLMLGGRPHGEIPNLLAQMDVLVMPSSFEGFGFSLIEAMAAGVVPVVSRIVGVTDWIVEDERTGFVCPIGDAVAFARKVEQLAKDPGLRADMSRRAHEEARSRFSLARMGDEYAALFNAVAAEAPASPPPAPWSDFEPCRAFEPTFRRWIPGSLKGRLRGWLERRKGRG